MTRSDWWLRLAVLGVLCRVTYQPPLHIYQICSDLDGEVICKYRVERN